MSDPSITGAPLLVFDQLTISYRNGGNTSVLEKFSLKLETGKFLAVVGPSGCGKSTLLHATGGFIKPAGGKILLDGQPIQEPSIRVGFVSQRYALFPWLTVENNIAFGLRSQGCTDNHLRVTVDELLEVIGLTGQRNYYPDQLSGGMQQRVALARAMAPNPPILLLDEPFSALDSDNRQKMRDLLLRLWTDHGTTILFVTHDVEEALLLADRVLLLERNIVSTRTVDIPFPRPRIPALVQTGAFQDMLKSISRHYELLSESIS